jgi:hypothetical protein
MFEEAKKAVRRVFGMAKSGLIPHGGTARNLELDFLRLIYAVEKSKADGDEAIGYICVLNAAMKKAIDKWIERYQTFDSVRVILPVLDDAQLVELEAEKKRNRAGNRKGSSPEDACAHHGRYLAESALREHITRVELGVVEAEGKHFGISWDFVGNIAPPATECQKGNTRTLDEKGDKT